jgi:hypothetical protein
VGGDAGEEEELEDGDGTQHQVHVTEAHVSVEEGA